MPWPKSLEWGSKNVLERFTNAQAMADLNVRRSEGGSKRIEESLSTGSTQFDLKHSQSGRKTIFAHPTTDSSIRYFGDCEDSTTTDSWLTYNSALGLELRMQDGVVSSSYANLDSGWKLAR